MTSNQKQYLIPDMNWVYQLSIHIAPTNNNKELLLTTRTRDINDKKDKRYNLTWLKNNIGSSVKKYVLDYLNPNRSKYLFFPVVILFERDTLIEPYHLHIGIGDIPNHQYFLSNRNKKFFKENYKLESPEYLTLDQKKGFFRNLFQNIHYKEYPEDNKRKAIMTSSRAFNMEQRPSDQILSYLSKSKKQKSWNYEWSSGFDATNIILLPRDLK